jgi:hypothetical protein
LQRQRRRISFCSRVRPAGHSDRLARSALASIAPPIAPSGVRAALAAWAIGFRKVIGAPALLLGIQLLLLALLTPLVLSLSRALAAALDGSGLAAPIAGPVPITDWEPFARHTNSLLETFAPRILGAAAPVDTLSGLADATMPPALVAAGAIVSAALWTLLWGGVIARFAGGPRGWSAFARASRLAALPLSLLALCTLVVYLVMLLAIHPLVFDGVVPLLTGHAIGRTAFIIRGVGYLVFGLLLAFCSVVADYTRIEIVLRGHALREALAAAWRTIYEAPVAIAVLAFMTAVLFAGALAGYGAFDLANRGAPDPWAAIAVGQAYILTRLAIRLIGAAAQVALTTRLDPGR